MMVTQDTGMSPETKAVHNTDRAALDELMRGFEAFKQENDRRLELIEKGRSGDVLVDEKLERINSFMDEAQTKMNDMLIKQGRPK